MPTAPSSGAKERRGGEETARPMEENRRGGGDRRRFASHPMSTPGPKASPRLASRREFTKARTVWSCILGANGDEWAWRGSVVEGGGGVSPHQLCLLWRLSAAVGSFAHTHSPFPPCSHCSPDIASYAKKPSASFIPPPGGRRSVSERGFTDYADIPIGCQDGTRQQ